MILLIVLPVLLIIFAFVALIEHYNAKLEELAEFINNPPPHDCCMLIHTGGEMVTRR